MKRIFQWIFRLTAFRIGIATGLLFALVHTFQTVRRQDVPLLAQLEGRMQDSRFHLRNWLRGTREPMTHVAIAAIDEKSIARYGRFPWDRRVLAELVTKLGQDGAAATALDIEFDDEDLGGQFAGAKRFRTRFDDLSLATGRGRLALDGFAQATGDIDGALSALRGLSGAVKPSGLPQYKAGLGRLDDGAQKLGAMRQDFEALGRDHAAYAAELDQELVGLNPDLIFGNALKANGRAVVGWVALTPDELSFMRPNEINEHIDRIERTHIGGAENISEVEGGGELITPVEKTWIKAYKGLRAPLAPIAKNSPSLGFFNTLPESDGVIRSVGLAMQVGKSYFPSVETAAVAYMLNVPLDRVRPRVATIGGERSDIDGIDFGGKLFVPTDKRGLMRVNYAGPIDAVQKENDKDKDRYIYSVADIMTDSIPAGALRGRVVMVAATAQGTFDQRVTPFDASAPGITVHANAVETILSHRFLRQTELVHAGEVVALLLLAVLFAFLFARVNVGFSLPAVLFASLGVYLASYALFLAGYHTIVALPLFELGSMFVLVTVYRYATEERDKRQLRKAFQLYLNPDVMEEMLQQPEKLQLGGDERELSVMFSDIRGFTTISEKLSPQALVHLLNDYLTPMTDLVFARRGTLDKYIGDAVMAFFGAPILNEKHALDSCLAALEMMETLGRLREKWKIEDPDIPFVDIGIGINSGPMVVGNMGSSQRFNYTVMGDNVNLASRLEGLNKDYGTHILISEGTLKSAQKASGNPQALAVRELDYVRVKGKKEPVQLFELRGVGEVPEADRPLLDTYAHGLALYRDRRFQEAQAAFRACLSIHPEDGPAALFVRRCDDMIAAPPAEGWDGVFKMEHK